MDKLKLQDGDVEAWTYLLRQNERLAAETVRAIEIELLSDRVTRFLLTLDTNLAEPISLITKATNPIEASIYLNQRSELSDLLPNMWHVESNSVDQTGYIVVEDVGNHFPSESWGLTDLEHIMQSLAALHAKFWDKRPQGSSQLKFTLSEVSHLDSLTDETISSGHGHAGTLQPFWALRELESATPLGLRLLHANLGLQILEKLRGWPEVIDKPHLDAMRDLLSSPKQFLRPLTEASPTLLHGYPIPEQWRLDLFNHLTLLNWENATLGCAMIDLASFVNHYMAWVAVDKGESSGNWEIQEETLIDNYFVALFAQLNAHGVKLDEDQSTRLLRRVALPAADCLYVLTIWLPEFVNWLGHLPRSRHTWEMLSEMDIDQQRSHGYLAPTEITPRLKVVFNRFLKSYRLLKAPIPNLG